jgi:hypothetical protein
MHFLIAYIRLRQDIIKVVCTCVVIGLALMLLIAMHPSLSGFTLLGDVSAPRPALDAAREPAYPRLGQPQHNTRQQGLTADLPPSPKHREQLFAALACTREQRGQPALTLDADLSAEAAALWKALMRDSAADIASLVAGRYPVVVVAPLTLEVAQAHADAYPAPQHPCLMGATDIGQLDLGSATTVGIAVFPDPRPEDGLDDSSAVIIAR